jgi:hypothetical protein
LYFCFLHSTNGTVINKLKVVKKQTCPLQTGDVIYLVYRKNEPEHSKRGKLTGFRHMPWSCTEGKSLRLGNILRIYFFNV